MAEKPNKYAMTLADLERSAHVPLADQTISQPRDASPGVLSEYELDQQRLLQDPAGAWRRSG
jgi:hypothetical protein